jgi:hypothetical protein
VRQAFHWLASRFSDCTDYRFELVAAGASGDLAYTLGYERFSFSMTAARSNPSLCASPTSTAARTASGAPSTAMPTSPNRSLRSADTSTQEALRAGTSFGRTILVSTRHPRLGVRSDGRRSLRNCGPRAELGDQVASMAP